MAMPRSLIYTVRPHMDVTEAVEWFIAEGLSDRAAVQLAWLIAQALPLESQLVSAIVKSPPLLLVLLDHIQRPAGTTADRPTDAVEEWLSHKDLFKGVSGVVRDRVLRVYSAQKCFFRSHVCLRVSVCSLISTHSASWPCVMRSLFGFGAPCAATILWHQAAEAPPAESANIVCAHICHICHRLGRVSNNCCLTRCSGSYRDQNFIVHFSGMTELRPQVSSRRVVSTTTISDEHKFALWVESDQSPRCG